MHTEEALNQPIKTNNKRKRPIIWIAIAVTAIVAIIAAILLINCITLPEPTKPGLYNERN
jgi:flagellar basal body-associated protein FliL